MTYPTQRSEPRFELGARVLIALNRGAAWQQHRGFTVNVSEHGLLVTLGEAPQVSERVRVKLPAPSDSWTEAVVRHVIHGRANFLVGMQLDETHGSWPLPRPAD